MKKRSIVKKAAAKKKAVSRSGVARRSSAKTQARLSANHIHYLMEAEENETRMMIDVTEGMGNL